MSDVGGRYRIGRFGGIPFTYPSKKGWFLIMASSKINPCTTSGSSIERLLRLVDTFPVVVTGARQEGKSTLLAHALDVRMDTMAFDPVRCATWKTPAGNRSSSWTTPLRR